MKILHISDLHWGKKFSPLFSYKLKEFAKEEKFDQITITGDLTQRAKKREFISVKRYLDSFQTPYIAVPGNHDVPLYPIHLRIFAPFYRYKKYFNEILEPKFINKKVCIFGLNSAHNWTSTEGRIKKKQIEKLKIKMLRTSPSQIIILLIHHPIVWADPQDRDRTIWGSSLLIDLFNELSPDLILSGHYHHRFFYNLRDFYPKLEKDIYLFFSSTSTTERGRKKERFKSGFNKITIDGEIKVERFLSDKDSFYNFETIVLRKNCEGKKIIAI